MKLSKERKVYIALFSAGLVALAVDRALFSPAQADAGEPDAAEPGAEAAAPEAQATKSRGPSFGARLAERASWVDGGVPDAFEPSEVWVGKRVAAVEAKPAAEPDSAFARDHKLKMVIAVPSREHAGAEERIAFVGSKHYKVGDILDGHELIEVRIAEREAVFRGPAGAVTLRVPGPGSTDRGAKGP